MHKAGVSFLHLRNTFAVEVRHSSAARAGAEASASGAQELQIYQSYLSELQLA